jgi:hypothetical protein
MCIGNHVCMTCFLVNSGLLSYVEKENSNRQGLFYSELLECQLWDNNLTTVKRKKQFSF